ncbi:hypothetical protein THTE_0033 [Thermogutta terrifontis]|uniref:Protein kinase domain-containing protein n=1 Tax=Thermogutta terrifontis TaxID=1331910 RepID=A0A286R9K1_9BACT|nr:hypothetical protein [Thermogutta terrifontis]ASV72635.1 hypothetical protein THTE_0033 [Thermogutta terrifontis]
MSQPQRQEKIGATNAKDASHAARGLLGEDGGLDFLSEGGLVLWRTVRDGVKYRPPPLPNHVPRWHQESRSRILFKMPLRDPPRRLFTLAQYCQQLREQRQELCRIPANSPIIPEPLRLLDEIVDKVLDLVEHLHAQHEGVGLLAPENILILEWENGITVSFTDLGFYWDDPLAPTLPAWLESDPKVNPHAELWENPRRQLERFDSSCDLRILGRVFCSALLGRPYRDVPDPDTVPETQADPPSVPLARRIWVVLAQIIHGELTSIDDIRQALREYPLSQHFLGPVHRRVSGWAIGLATATVLLTLGALIFAIWLILRAPDHQASDLSQSQSPQGTGTSEDLAAPQTAPAPTDSHNFPVSATLADLEKSFTEIVTQYRDNPTPVQWEETNKRLRQLREQLRNSSGAQAEALRSKVERFLELEFPHD